LSWDPTEQETKQMNDETSKFKYMTLSSKPMHPTAQTGIIMETQTITAAHLTTYNTRNDAQVLIFCKLAELT